VTSGRLGALLLLATATLGASVKQPSVPPGGIVRWAGSDLVGCRLGERSWLPLDGACWYPVDLFASGELTLESRSRRGTRSRAVRVGAYPYPTQELQVEEKYVAPSAEELARIEREQKAIDAVLALSTPRRFTLPLAPPLAELPAASRFGARRVFNGEARNPHSGADFPAKTGEPVYAAADGVVALAGEQFFAGNAVFVDHGDGLISMSFHLSEIAVKAGEKVKRGQLLGRVGATGRVTGPHLHFGVRWHGARVDPGELIAGKPALELN
jgi:murein DD-endopeptidase MepM/ murein hydrolase activator NlpD